MLGQAAAMLIPFPAAIATKFSQSTLPFASDQVGSFAGSTTAIFGGGRRGGCRSSRVAGIWRCGRGRRRGCTTTRGRGMIWGGKVACDRGNLTGTVHTPGEIGRGTETRGISDRTGFHERFPATSSPVVWGHGNGTGGGLLFTAGFLVIHGGRNCRRSSIGSSRRSDTFATSNTVVLVDGSERDGVGMVPVVVGMGEGTREGQFLTQPVVSDCNG